MPLLTKDSKPPHYAKVTRGTVSLAEEYMKKAEKLIIISSLQQRLSEAKSAVLVDYKGLTVKKQQELARELKKVGACLLVIKNTLFKRSAEGLKLPSEITQDEVLSGQTALVLGLDDAIAPIAVLGKFAKENEIPHFKVGVVEGKFQNTDSLIAISQLPSKEVLFGQVVGAIASPMYGIVGVLRANLQKLVWILKEVSMNV